MKVLLAVLALLIGVTVICDIHLAHHQAPPPIGGDDQ